MSHSVRCKLILKAIMGFFILGCLSVQAGLRDGASVAVWDIEYVGPMPVAYQDMSGILSAKIIETFKESGRYKIVEREQLLLALEELNIGSSSFADKSARLRIGRIVGAKYMVFGTYFVLNENMRLDLRLIEVETGKVAKATQKTTNNLDPIEWIELAGEAGRDLF